MSITTNLTEIADFDRGIRSIGKYPEGAELGSGSLTTWPVTPRFRERILAELAPDGSESAYLNLIGYLIFASTDGTWQRDQKPLPVSSRLLARLCGREPAHHQRNFDAGKHLLEFPARIGRLRIRKHDFRMGQCRVVSRVRLSPAIIAAINDEVDEVAVDGLVQLASGEPIDRKRQKEINEARRSHALKLLSTVTDRPNIGLAEYLNHIPFKAYEELLLRLPAAAAEVRRIDNRLKRHRVVLVLRACAESPQPFVKCAAGTLRLCPVSVNLMTLKREARKPLTSGWCDADLRGAQLAICAKLWGVGSILDLLGREGRVWTVLATQAGLPENDAAEAAIKKAVYSAAFGKLRWKIRESLTATVGDEAARRFLSLEVIEDLFEARVRQMRSIKENAGAVDCYGRHLPLGKEIEERVMAQPGTFTCRSILAQLAQSVEYKLLEPAFDLIMESTNSHGCCLHLYMYDGLMFTPRRSAEKLEWQKKLSAVVDRRAAQLDVQTRLVFK